MRLLVFTQGHYGERILENIRTHAPQGWIISRISLPGDLPPIIEEPEEAIEGLGLEGEWDLVIFMGESPSAFSLLPAILVSISASAVIAPADDYSWLPLGLERQIKSEIEEMGVGVVFPRTFCTLSPTGDPAIDEFARVFGSPRLRLETEDGAVRSAKVLRGAPCGSTRYMAERLPGTRIEEAGSRAGTLVQIYPCLASRRVDRHFGDAPIHVAGHIAQKAVERAMEE